MADNVGHPDFLQTAIGAAAASQTRPLFSARPQSTGVIGANDRIRAAIIGCGGRGNAVATEWMKHADSVFVASCDVAQDRLENSTARLSKTQDGAKLDGYEDYRRILDRKDVDVLLIATPDHCRKPSSPSRPAGTSVISLTA